MCEKEDRREDPGRDDHDDQAGYDKDARDQINRRVSPRRSPRRGAGHDGRIAISGRGPRSWDRSSPSNITGRDSRREPPLPEGIIEGDLDCAVWRELRTLSKKNAEGVAKHLLAAASVLECDPNLALAHAEHAARRAGRVSVVREALGLVYYRRSEFTDAIREFRTAKRLSGSNHLLPYLVDCERGLGRYERALDLAASEEARGLAEAENIELAIVMSGVRRDLGQPDVAVMMLHIPALERATHQPWAARLFYAYAEALLTTGDESGAREWFAKAVDADDDDEIDAADRLDALDGLVMIDLLAADE